MRAAVEYDAATEDATAFLTRVAPVTTPAELDRLRTSPRARLDWPVLRDRGERVEVALTGVSVSGANRVVVAAERTTRTGFATVRDFVELRLELVRIGDTFKVAAAEGGGL